MADDATPTDQQPSTHAAQEYTAVVFFHGMGSQRHYEGISELVESLNRRLRAQPRAERSHALSPRLFREPARFPPDATDDVVFLRASSSHTVTEGNPKWIRFYEAYWAPMTADGTTTLGVLRWLLRQAKRPLEVLGSPWSKFERLRRADLLRATDDLSSDSPSGREVRQLLKLYHEFLQPWSSGKSFGDFLSFVERDAKHPAPELLPRARSWRRRHVLSELLRALALFSIVLTALAASSLLLVYIAKLFLYLGGQSWATIAGSKLEPSAENLLAALAAFFSMMGVGRALNDYVGDVQQFVTYEEAESKYERRKKVLEYSVRQLRHVLEDVRCKRVVVVGHSLGSVVALDALLQLRHYNLARNRETPSMGPIPLRKLQHFVTFGSPIDKVNYFFAALQSSFRSYETLIEALRGDLGEVPFSREGRQPWVHWINFWDRGDLVSGSIETVQSHDLREHRVDNVRIVANSFPDPAYAHTSYLQDPLVLDTLHDVVVHDRHNWTDPERIENRPVWRLLGPGRGSLLQTALLLVPAPLPILLVCATLEAMHSWHTPFRWLVFGLVASLGLGGWLQRKLLTSRRIRKART